MKVLYHFMPMPPAMPGCVAELQEIDTLKDAFDGELCYLNPNAVSPIYLPRFLFGIHRYQWLRQQEAKIDLHHVYNPDPYPYPLLRWLRRPVVYTISGGVDRKPLNARYFNALGAVQVADEESVENLRQQGVGNAVAIRPSIDPAKYSVAPIPPLKPFRLLMGSAPWTMAQFESKGINALLDAAVQDPSLEIIFLWRGVLEAEMHAKVRAMNLSQQVTVINEEVDVNEILASVHAAVALSATVGIMKAYPHSLLDAFAAGRPVFTNKAVPMSSYVDEKGVGVVIEQVTPDDILRGVERLKCEYGALQKSTRTAAESDFSQRSMIEAYRNLYTQIVS